MDATEGSAEIDQLLEGIAPELDRRLGLSRCELFVLANVRQQQRHHSVRVSWHFSCQCTLLDWIGLFLEEETDPLAFMDYRGFGVCGPKQGSVDWPLGTDMLLLNNNNNNIDHGQQSRRNNNAKDNDKNNNSQGKKSSLQFRYFDGLSGAMKASSPHLLVYSDAQLAISALSCPQLAGTKCGLYAKLSCSGSASRVYRTGLSTDGQWPSLNFLFPADRSAELRIRLKADRHWPAAGKLCGEANISVLDLLEASGAASTEKEGRHFSFLLRPQCVPMLLKCRLVPPLRQPLAETMGTLGAADSNGNLNGHLLLPSSMDGQMSASTSSSTGATTSSSSGSSSAQMGQSICSSALSSSSASSQLIQAQSVKLPPGWEVRLDGQGRIFYIDHIRQRTAWTAPLVLERSEAAVDETARTARRTVLGPPTETEMAAAAEDVVNGNRAPDSDGHCPAAAEETAAALQFLLRDDLFGHLLQGNEQALALYNGSPFLKHIVQRIRRMPAKYWQFERNRELVNFVNAFADQTQPLPVGWQLARQSGQPLFIDHANRRITAFDPRLPELLPRSINKKGGCRSAPPVRRNKKCPSAGQRRTAAERRDSPSPPMHANGNGIWSWELAEKADQIQALLAEQCPELAQRVSAKLRLIGRMGELALLRYANDPELVRAISLLEQMDANGMMDSRAVAKEPPKSQFEMCLAKFHTALEKAGYGRGPTRIRFRLRRERLMEDAFQKILAANPGQLRKCQMTVSFAEEEGLDYGGPSRELFFLLSRELFHPRHGLFEYAGADSHRVQISAMSKFVDHHLRWMELCGRILGLALIHRCLLDCFFTRPFYKMLAQIPLCLEDLRETDPQLCQSLEWLRRNPVSAELDLTFCVTEELAGQVTERELKPNGRNLPVTDGNKEQFVELMLRWRAERGVQQQSQALLRGLNAVVDPEHIRLFDADQLELALSGNVQIDMADWERRTEYRGGYHARHVVIRWFWQSVQEMRNADRLRLLQFVTGSSSVPFEGFKGLRGSNGPKRFCIERWGAEDSLPRAHTCFNRLDLPAYPNRQTLVAKLMLAITESSSYAIE